MIVKYNNKIYDIEKLSSKSDYFDALKSSNFSENINGVLDLSHREETIKYFLDMLNDESYVYDLSSIEMSQIIPFLDEFLVHDQYYNNMLMMSISIQGTKETHKKIEDNFKKKKE